MLHWILIVISCLDINNCIPEIILDDFESRAECEEMRKELLVIPDNEGYPPTLVCTPTTRVTS